MLIPSPVPSILRFLTSSIRSNSAESFGKSSALMPIPVSSTSKRNTAFSSTTRLCTRSQTVPSCVYLTALVRILIKTCRIRTSSPYRREGIWASISTFKSSALSAARCDAIFTKSCIMLLISYAAGTISIFPESILEKSRISLINDNSVWPAV